MPVGSDDESDSEAPFAHQTSLILSDTRRLRIAGPTAIDRDREPAGKRLGGVRVAVTARSRRGVPDSRVAGGTGERPPGPLGGSKQRARLASSLLHANEVVSRDRLVDELRGAASRHRPDGAPGVRLPTAHDLPRQLRGSLGSASGSHSRGPHPVPARHVPARGHLESRAVPAT